MPEFDIKAVENFIRRAKGQTPMPRHADMYTHFEACLAEIDRLNERAVDSIQTIIDASTVGQKVGYWRGLEEARPLVERLVQVHDDPDYQDVWETAQIARGPYTGPTYTKELEDLQYTLNAGKEDSDAQSALPE